MRLMRAAYFDCFSGASGDMILGALLGCDGVNHELFREYLAKLSPLEYELNIERVKREGITATDVNVRLTAVDQGHGRHLSDIAEILEKSSLPGRVKEKSLAVFTRLADAEAKIHGTSREEIHFHEVGAVDAIVDIAGSCILMEMLGIERVFVSAFPCGTGTITCQHGIMPCPAPATVELLAGFPVYSVDIKGELVTPTGAALLTTIADPETAGQMPGMRIVTSGYGAGKKQFKKDMPNLLRVIIGEMDDSDSESDGDPTPKTICVLETNIDDLSPEMFELTMERLFEAGALDVFLTPIQMKKNRPGHIMTVLCSVETQSKIAQVVMRETGTFGVRTREQKRYTLTRSWQSVETPFGTVRLKIGRWHGEVIATSPEYADCKAAAIAHNVPLREVYRAAMRLADREA